MSLPISAVVDVSVSITPASPPKIGFGIAAVVSSELTISGLPLPNRLQYFNSANEVAELYALTTEAYKCAAAYFAQSPAPDQCAIIAQYLTATKAVLTGGQQVDTDLAVWQAIADGSFEIEIQGVQVQVQNADFQIITDMDEVAVALQIAIRAADASTGFALCEVVFESINNRFIITSGDTAGTISFTLEGLSGTDISPLMQTEVTQGGNLVQGRGPENAVDALQAADDFDKGWYGVLLTNIERDKQIVEDVAAWVEARVKVFANVSHNPNSLLLNNEDNVGARINAANFTRTTMLYSSTGTQYPDAAMMGKAFVVDFSADNSVLTLKFKPLATITAEKFTSGEKGAIDEKRMNAYITVGGADMFAESFMASQLFFDERHGVDWLVGELEFNVFAYLLSRATKVPATDAGTTSLVQQVIRTLDLARRNGLIAAGTTTDGVFLPNGYDVTYGKVADQPPSDKAARIAPTINFVALLAGAFHFVQINGVVER